MSERQYFLAFDFYNRDINKFNFGVVTVDLSKNDIKDVCRQIVKDSFNDIEVLNLTIKVTALNNIDI